MSKASKTDHPHPDMTCRICGERLGYGPVAGNVPDVAHDACAQGELRQRFMVGRFRHRLRRLAGKRKR